MTAFFIFGLFFKNLTGDPGNNSLLRDRTFSSISYCLDFISQFDPGGTCFFMETQPEAAFTDSSRSHLIIPIIRALNQRKSQRFKSCHDSRGGVIRPDGSSIQSSRHPRRNLYDEPSGAHLWRDPRRGKRGNIHIALTRSLRLLTLPRVRRYIAGMTKGEVGRPEREFAAVRIWQPGIEGEAMICRHGFMLHQLNQENDSMDPEKKNAKPAVNTHNEWDPLEEMIVGMVEGAMIPPWES